ncbi:MAG: hypothetical protein ACI8UO_000247 [Verrucomicrobiales bacterium]|jgi:hypothetical protein
MESNNRHFKTSCGDFHCEISSPVLRILQVNDRGVVFETRQSFEIGASIKLGFHVRFTVGASEAKVDPARNEFISGEGLVVDCKLCAAEDGSSIHEVTLLFSSMSPRDCRALRRFKRLEDIEQLLEPTLETKDFSLN